MIRRAVLLLCATLACSTTPESQVEPGHDEDAHDESLVPEAEPPVWGTPLIRGEGHDVRITEVWLDERASAALSLDGFGQVRLWPTLAELDDLAGFAPIRLPIHEPSSLSFVRTAEGFVITTVDTARTGRVIEVRIDEAGAARMIERFTIGPTDPLLELHVLAGGERLLALGVDHRIRLYDGQGKPLAELSEHGFIPWQLRVQPNRIVAVLGSPTRVQTIELRDDQLTRVGELRTTLLDRGANLNDLQLTPDGQRVAVFRRPSSKARTWSLQLIDLDDGEVRVLAGKVDGTIRPRLHLVDDQRALIEDGTGVGYWIDLQQGAALAAGFVLPEDHDDLPAQAHVEARRIPLTRSIGRERWHASVVAGIRAVPGDHELVLDAVDDPNHRRLGHAPLAVSEAALSAKGSLAAWSIGDFSSERIVVDDLAAPGPMFTVPEFDSAWILGLAFVDDEHLLVASSKHAVILAWRTGEQLAEHVDDARVDALGVRERPPGQLEHALGTSKPMFVVDRQFVATDPASAIEWAWVDLWDEVATSNLRGHHFEVHRRSQTSRVTIRDGKGRSVELALRASLDLMAASPCGRWLAIVEDDSMKIYGKTVGPRIARLAVYALGDLDQVPRTVWSMPVIDDRQAIDLAWSADGERLAIAERSVGALVVTASGEVVFERRHGELSESQAPDQPLANE